MAGPLNGDRLRGLRKERAKHIGRRLTQVEVADAVGAERSHYTHMEGGRAQPSVQVLVAIADYFGASTDYLLGRSDIRVVQQQADLAERAHERTSDARLRQLPEEDRRLVEDMIARLETRLASSSAAPGAAAPARKLKNNPT